MSQPQTVRRVNWLATTIANHKAGSPVGVYSVCSAHPMVVEAAITQAAAEERSPAHRETRQPLLRRLVRLA